VLALGRALGERRGIALLVSSPESAARPDDARFSFVASDPVETTEDLVPTGKTGATFGYAGNAAAPRWVGFVPYEALRGIERNVADTRPLPWVNAPRWHRYDAVLRVDHWTGEVSVEADDEVAAMRLVQAASRKPTPAGTTTLDRIDDGDDAHAARVASALDYIARGDIYQVNLARRLRFHVAGAPLDLFASVFGKAPAPWGVFLEVNDDLTVLGTSPELALEARGGHLRTGPIKGTRPRGTCFATDAAERRDLETSEKEHAELVMAVDLHRNDLGRVAEVGSVRVLPGPRTLASRTVLSRVHEVVARRGLSCDLSRVVSAMLPCGSVTGAPKVRAMEIIANLEPNRRGLYTGAVGYVGRDGGLVLAMAIRTAVVSRAEEMLEYFTGGGIVVGSDPRREVAETEWKARQLVDIAS
jgi:anthranilate/para-aminobenzoate synthase component I